MSENPGEFQLNSRSRTEDSTRLPYRPPRLAQLDPQEIAPKLLIAARDQANAEAAYMLSLMYQRGIAVQKNRDQALYWLLEASKLGHATAGEVLRHMQISESQLD